MPLRICVSSLWKWVSALALCLFPNFVAGFESDEHKQISDLSLSVVSKLVDACQTGIPETDQTNLALNICPVLRDKRMLEVIREFESHPSHANELTYGDIVACVDYFPFPEQMFRFFLDTSHDQGRSRSTDFDSRRRAATHESLPFSKAQFALTNKDCNGSILRYMQSSHNNQSHFQRDALVFHRFYHTLAITIARDEQNLYSALAMNAISDHYLEDFFAPGHMTTPRDSLVDVAAQAAHDRANREGVVLHLHFNEAAKHSGDDPSVLNHRLEGISAILEYLPVVFESDRDVLRKLACRDYTEGKHFCDSWNSNKYSQEVNSHIRSMLRKEKLDVEAKGDGFLWREGVHGLRQRIVMLAVEVRAVLDILEAYSKGSKIRNDDNSFKSLVWANDQDTGTVAGFQFGHYSFGTNVISSLLPTAVSNVDDQSDENEVNGQVNPDASIADEQQSGTSRYIPGTFDKIFAVNIGRENLTAGTRVGRNTLSLEWAPVSFRLKLLGEDVNLIPYLGYIRYRESELHGSGPALRLSIKFPKVDFAFGPYVRRLTYAGLGVYEHRTSMGVRTDFGYTHLGIYLSLGRDFDRRDDGSIGRGWSFSGGLHIACTLPRLFSTFCVK